MKLFLKGLALSLAGVLLYGCAQPEPPADLPGGSSAPTPAPAATAAPRDDSAEFQEYADQLFVDEMSEDFLGAHFYLKDPAAYGLRDMEPSLGELSLASIEEGEAQIEEELRTLREFDYSALTEDQKILYDNLVSILETEQTSQGMGLLVEYNSMPSGVQSNLPTTLMDYRFYTAQDVEDYLLLLKDFPRYFADALAFQKQKSEAGYFMPDFALDDALEAGRKFTEPGGSDFMRTSFSERVEKLPGLTHEQKQDFIARNEQALTESVIPAYHTLLDGMEALRGTGTNDKGLCYYPQGKEFYAYLVRSNTGSDRTVEEIIRLLEETLWQRLDAVFELNRRDPEKVQRALDLMGDPAYSSDPAVLLEGLESGLLDLFPPLSKKVNYHINKVPDALSDGNTLAYYMRPPIDTPSDNAIYVNEKNLSEDLLFYTTLAHEGFPGHLYQNNYFLGTDPHPLRTIVGQLGYSEGWASYAALLSYELLGYDDPELCGVMENWDSLNTLISARVDLGVNYEGWTIEELGAYMGDMGYSNDPDTMESIYQSLVEDPGVYLSYGVGLAEFLKLRERAETALGPDFDEISYHQAILECGPAPFHTVRRVVDAYIAENGGQAPADGSSQGGGRPRLQKWAA